MKMEKISRLFIGILLAAVVVQALYPNYDTYNMELDHFPTLCYQKFRDRLSYNCFRKDLTHDFWNIHFLAPEVPGAYNDFYPTINYECWNTVSYPWKFFKDSDAAFMNKYWQNIKNYKSGFDMAIEEYYKKGRCFNPDLGDYSKMPDKFDLKGAIERCRNTVFYNDRYTGRPMYDASKVPRCYVNITITLSYIYNPYKILESAKILPADFDKADPTKNAVLLTDIKKAIDGYFKDYPEYYVLVKCAMIDGNYYLRNMKLRFDVNFNPKSGLRGINKSVEFDQCDSKVDAKVIYPKFPGGKIE